MMSRDVQESPPPETEEQRRIRRATRWRTFAIGQINIFLLSKLFKNVPFSLASGPYWVYVLKGLSHEMDLSFDDMYGLF